MAATLSNKVVCTRVCLCALINENILPHSTSCGKYVSLLIHDIRTVCCFVALVAYKRLRIEVNNYPSMFKTVQHMRGIQDKVVMPWQFSNMI